MEREPTAQIAYFVFGAKNCKEAEASGKFNTNHVAIMTTHAFAKKVVFPGNCEPVDSFNREAVFQRLDFESATRMRIDAALRSQGLGSKKIAPKKLKNVAKTIATVVTQTVSRFCYGETREVDKFAIPFDFCEKQTEEDAAFNREKKRWRPKKWMMAQFKDADYIGWAEELIRIARNEMKGARDNGGAPPVFRRANGPGNITALKNVGTPHDFYLKQFQLQRINLGGLSECEEHRLKCAKVESPHNTRGFYFQCPHGCRGQQLTSKTFDYIILDEAQDLTPCQSSAFCKNQPDAVCYLIGDEHQRIYGWRGVRDCFESGKVDHEFALTNSFRFGPTIARAAECVLQRIDPQRCVRGLGTDEGADVQRLDWGEHFRELSTGPKRMSEPSIVLTRSNKGMLNALVQVLESTGAVPKWGFIQERGAKSMLDVTKIQRLTEFWFTTPSDVEEHVSDWFVAIEDASGSSQGVDDDTYNGHEHSGVDAPSRPAGGSAGLKPRSTFCHDREVFHCWADLKDYCDEARHNTMFTLISLVEEYGERTPEIIEKLKANKVASTSDRADVFVGTVHSVKGLEYSQPVIVFDDFSHKTLPMQGEALTPGKKEILNLIYVAITRAKKKLRFASDLWWYVVDQLGVVSGKCSVEEEEILRERVRPEKENVESPEELRKAREVWGVAWKVFEERSRDYRESRGDDNPTALSAVLEVFPEPPRRLEKGNPFCISEAWSSDELKAFLRDCLRKYHPDKTQDLVDRAEAYALGAVSERVKETRKRATEYLSRFKKGESASDPTAPFVKKDAFARGEMRVKEEEEFLGRDAKRRRVDSQ